MKVVESGYKIDLHIHSVCSRAKDKGKVAFNTIDNIGVLAEKLNVSSQINWHGQVNHDEVGVLMDSADIFLFTSVSEATSTVTMEAISHGLPVVCFDACGFGLVVEDGMGIKIPLGDPAESAKAFAFAIQKLVESPSLRARMSETCYRKASILSWDYKVKRVLSLYEEVLSG